MENKSEQETQSKEQPEEEKQKIEEIPFVQLLHSSYLFDLDKTMDSDAIGHYTTEHLKLPGAYWCISALKVINKLDLDRKEEIVKFVQAC